LSTASEVHINSLLCSQFAVLIKTPRSPFLFTTWHGDILCSICDLPTECYFN